MGNSSSACDTIAAVAPVIAALIKNCIELVDMLIKLQDSASSMNQAMPQKYYTQVSIDIKEHYTNVSNSNTFLRIMLKKIASELIGLSKLSVFDSGFGELLKAINIEIQDVHDSAIDTVRELHTKNFCVKHPPGIYVDMANDQLISRLVDDVNNTTTPAISMACFLPEPTE